jgi:hypothetical protein
LANRSSEPTGVPIWFVVWCLVVAAIWLTPAPLIDRFVVGPLFDDTLGRALSERNLSASNVASMHRLWVQLLRVMASVFPVLYLVVRALTARWRHQETAS